MVSVDPAMEDFKFILKEGREFVNRLLPVYKGIIKSLPEEEKKNAFFEGPTPLNNWQLSVILTYASLLEKMLEVEDGRNQE